MARTTGLLYLIVIVCAGFAEGFVRSGLVVPGDAAATAANIAANDLLFRAGLVADIVAFLCDLAVAVLLYVLLRHVNETVALLAAAFRLVAHPAIAGLNLLNHHNALMLLDGARTPALDAAQRESLAMLSLDAHGIGYLIAGAFFGVHCLLLGWLLYRSAAFPRLLGVLLTAAAFGYLIESFGGILFPAYDAVYTYLVAVPAVIGEGSLCLYLLIRGTAT
jgi:hypothetical protein